MWVVLLSVGLIGIPHGAIDHIMAAELYDLNLTLKVHFLFYTSYLFVMVIVGALWIIFPETGMVLSLLFQFTILDRQTWKTSWFAESHLTGYFKLTSAC